MKQLKAKKAKRMKKISQERDRGHCGNVWEGNVLWEGQSLNTYIFGLRSEEDV